MKNSFDSLFRLNNQDINGMNLCFESSIFCFDIVRL